MSQLVYLPRLGFKFFNRNSISIVISGDGISIKILLIPQVSKKVQRDAIYRKKGEFKTQPIEKKFEVNKYSKISKFLPPPSHFPPSPLPLWEHSVSS